VVGLGPIVGRSVLFIGPCNTCCGPCLLRRLRGLKHRLLQWCSTLLLQRIFRKCLRCSSLDWKTLGYCNNYTENWLFDVNTALMLSL